MTCAEFREKNLKKVLDAVRLYEGDIRIRDEAGNLVNRQSTDPLYGDKNAYRTLNALLFPGISNEISRIQKEGKKLNPAFLERIEETIDLYCHIFRLMCGKYKIKGEECLIAKRIERLSTLTLLKQGQTRSFISASKVGYDEEFAKKDGVILIEMHISSDVPYLDFKEILGSEYQNIDEQEVLLAPFVDIKIKERELTLAEQRSIKDLKGNPPVGKYQINTVGIQDFRVGDGVETLLETMKDDIVGKRDIPFEAVSAMNKGEWEKNFTRYTKWKEELQKYLKYKLSDMWYSC